MDWNTMTTALTGISAGGVASLLSMKWMERRDDREGQRRQLKHKHQRLKRPASRPGPFSLARQEQSRVIKESEAQLRRQLAEEKRANTVGPRIRWIGAMLPVGEEWRIEEMMNHRNELREQHGRVPRFHYVRLFLSALEIRWEARVYPKRRVE